MGRRLVTALAAGLWLALAMPGYGQETAAADPDLQSVANVLEAATNLPRILTRTPLPEGDSGLREAVETERLRLVQILRDDGYLGAEIALEWPDPSLDDISTMQVRVDPGPRYALGEITVATTGPIPGEVMEQLQSTAEMVVGDNATAGALDDLSSRLIWTLGQSGYPFARINNVDFELDHEMQSAKLAVGLDIGGLSRFADTDFAEVDPGLRNAIAPLIPFAEGDLYSVEALVSFRQNLAALAGADDTRAEIVPAGDNGFSLTLRAERSAVLPTSTLESNLGFGLLIATLGALAVRQAAVSAGAARAAVRTLSIATGGLLLGSGCLLALRVLSLV